MTDKPKTLEDALAALDRLEKVVDRLADRINALEDIEVPVIGATVNEHEDTITWLMDRTDEAGADAIRAKKLATLPDVSSGPRVERVRKGNQTVARLVHSR